MKQQELFQEEPRNKILPLDLCKVIIEDYQADLTIIDIPTQIYGKALHGRGRVTFKNGNFYEGEFENGMLHGRGLFIWATGIKYTGEFLFNEISGIGRYDWPSGAWYEGQVLRGLRNGDGTYCSATGEVTYKGNWVSGLRHGVGILLFTNGARYEGEFFEGYKHGRGRMTYPSGNFYEGEWHFDKKEGYGIMHWLDTKEKYIGQWNDNKPNGRGIHMWLEDRGEGKFLRNRYEGEWLNGLRHGTGVFYYANGSRYAGEWVANLKEGFSFFTDENGVIVRGYFKNDRLIEERHEPPKEPFSPLVQEKSKDVPPVKNRGSTNQLQPVERRGSLSPELAPEHSAMIKKGDKSAVTKATSPHQKKESDAKKEPPSAIPKSNGGQKSSNDILSALKKEEPPSAAIKKEAAPAAPKAVEKKEAQPESKKKEDNNPSQKDSKKKEASPQPKEAPKKKEASPPPKDAIKKKEDSGSKDAAKKKEAEQPAKKAGDKAEPPKITVAEEKKTQPTPPVAVAQTKSSKEQQSTLVAPGSEKKEIELKSATLDPKQGSLRELKSPGVMPPSSRQKPDGSPGRPKDKDQASAAPPPRREVDANPYLQMIEIDDLLVEEKNKLEVVRNITNTMLRYHSQFKIWYKKYSPLSEADTEETLSFSMDLGSLWKFIKDTRIGNHRLTLASFNRCFLQGGKNRFEVSLDLPELKKELKYEKLLFSQHQSADGSHLGESQSPSHRLTKIDWNSFSADAQDKPLPNHMYIPINANKEVHDEKRVLFFRHFVDSIVRMAYLKYEVTNLADLPKYIEKMLTTRIIPHFEGKKKAQSHASNDDEMILAKYFVHVTKHTDALRGVFYSALGKKQSVYGMRDSSISIKHLADLLTSTGQFRAENLNIFCQIVERTNEFQDTVQYAEIQKEKTKSHGKARDKDERVRTLFGVEILFPEFLEFLTFYFSNSIFLHEGEKVTKEESLKRQVLKLINMTEYYTTDKKAPWTLMWPVTDKDETGRLMRLEKLRLKREEEARQAKKRELESEARERREMEKEDVRIPDPMQPELIDGGRPPEQDSNYDSDEF